jgi:hypothetical protein
MLKLLKTNKVEGTESNSYESAVSFCRQMAAWVPNMFFYFNSVKNHNTASNSSTTETGEKISTNFELFEL